MAYSENMKRDQMDVILGPSSAFSISSRSCEALKGGGEDGGFEDGGEEGGWC